MNEHDMTRELASTINRISLDSRTNIPDHILAEYLMRCAMTFASVHQQANEWRGIPLWVPGQTVTVTEMQSELRSHD